MQMNQPKKNYRMVETKRGSGEELQHNMRFSFNNGWELSLSLGPASYSKKVPCTDMHEQVEAAIFQEGNMLYIAAARDTVIGYLPVIFIQCLCEILDDADTAGAYQTLKDIEELVTIAYGRRDSEEE